MKKKLIAVSGLLALAFSVGAFVGCGADKHEFSQSWSGDDAKHWHACTIEGHTDRADEATHVFDREVAEADYLSASATATAPAKYFKSCVCGKKGTDTFDYGSALGAQINDISVKNGVSLNKTYDKKAVAFTKDDFTYNGDGEVTFEYKASDAAVFDSDAPFVAGDYVVKVSVAGTSEWKAVEKEFDFTIEKVRLASIEKPIVVEYDGKSTEFDLTSRITEKVTGDDIKLVVKTNGFAVGSTMISAELSGNDDYNYTYDTTKLSVTVGKARINIGHNTYYSYYISGAWQTVFALKPADGVVEKDGLPENVSIRILKDNEWENGKTFALYTEDASTARNIERVKLVGADAGNYYFECSDKGDLGASLDCKINHTSITGALSETNDYDWGGITIDDITFADKSFIIRGDQGELTDKLVEAENNFKQLYFEMYITGTSIKIAEGKRLLWHEQEELIDPEFTEGCEYIVNDGGPDDMRFSLIKNVDGYTDGEGYWICPQAEVGFTLKVTEKTTTVNTGDTLFEDDTLGQNGTVVAKYTFSHEEEATSIKLELSDGATAEVDVKVYGFITKNGKTQFGEIVPDASGDYYVEKGRTYYIRILVTKAGTGNVTLNAYN